jgi:hypothetical protein
MKDGRQGNGRFGPGNRANPNGRPLKDRSVRAAILRELNTTVVITENNRKKRITKLAANAKQIANKGALGELRAAKMSLDLAMKADHERGPSAPSQALGTNDVTIVERFIARLRATHIEESDNATDA